MSKMRHWKQHFDPDAILIFRKRMVIRGYGVDTAQPGDVVPQEMKDHFGVHRLKIWWEGGFLAIQDQAELEAPQVARERDMAKILSNGLRGVVDAPEGAQSVVHVGGGFYDVTRNGETTRVRGKKNIPVPF